MKRLYSEYLLWRAGRYHRKAAYFTGRASECAKRGRELACKAVGLGSATGRYE